MRSLLILLSLLHIVTIINKPLPVKKGNSFEIRKEIYDPLTDEDKFPPPPENLSRLFYVQRTSNANTIMYELNADKNGRLLDTENPIHVYWLKYAENGQKEELNYIQRKFAYGVITRHTDNEGYDVRFVSYKKFPLTLMKAGDGKYHIFASVNQKQLILNRIFLKIEGGTFWLPNVVYVELRGVDPLTGKEIAERFKTLKIL